MPVKEIRMKSINVSIGLMLLFVIVVSYSLVYAYENYDHLDSACGCVLPLWTVILTMACFGVATGSMVYYALTRQALKEKRENRKAIAGATRFLEPKEREVFEFVLKSGGRVSQSKIPKGVGISAVEASRAVSRLERRGALKKEPHGMTNLVRLAEGMEIFLEE